MSLLEIAQMGGGGILLLTILVEVAPIKLNPWSWLAKAVGRALNGEVLDKVGLLEWDVLQAFVGLWAATTTFVVPCIKSETALEQQTQISAWVQNDVTSAEMAATFPLFRLPFCFRPERLLTEKTILCFFVCKTHKYGKIRAKFR